ncbi:Two-component transcriptional response regulator, LuxR family [uncultured Synechococcales cyanobacterium]|uniref:Two-component transcriptional response regulator, LuxR family n=1 Tax=uncultured Synechococcales cyanobacterium TaxID=1936017 RepID=A0A6J4UT41_9CYAN|nr:Two-component transcriptional response regulator, LuxR family [uncultured Synechococcales cyanobacterium]
MLKENPIRILIADDHPILRKGLRSLIEREADMAVVSEANNGREAVELFRQHQPNITLMDLRMPQMEGVEAITRIRKQFLSARIIVLTTYDGDEDIYRGLRAGAKAYLLKDAPPEELLETIRSVHTGQTYIPANIAVKLAERINNCEPSPRELEVLHLMVQGKPNKDIALALFITEGTVKAHINNLLKKLGVSDRTQAVTTALKRGIVHLD